MLYIEHMYNADVLEYDGVAPQFSHFTFLTISSSV